MISSATMDGRQDADDRYYLDLNSQVSCDHGTTGNIVRVKVLSGQTTFITEMMVFGEPTQGMICIPYWDEVSPIARVTQTSSLDSPILQLAVNASNENLSKLIDNDFTTYPVMKNPAQDVYVLDIDIEGMFYILAVKLTTEWELVFKDYSIGVELSIRMGSLEQSCGTITGSLGERLIYCCVQIVLCTHWVGYYSFSRQSKPTSEPLEDLSLIEQPSSRRTYYYVEEATTMFYCATAFKSEAIR